jgi:hypothetical protein
MNPFLTDHSELRMSQRNLSLDDVNYVMTYGQKLHRAGALIFFLRKRDIPAWDLPSSRLTRLAGTAVVASRDGRVVITAWRNLKRGLSHIKVKPINSRHDQDEFWPNDKHKLQLPLLF